MRSVGTAPGHRNALLYWTAAGLLVVLVVVALATYRSAARSALADERADELLVALEEAGAQRLPAKDQVVRLFGDDGGSVCQDPGHALRQATYFSMLMNGASGPGMRPVVADTRVVQGQLVVMGVYCPDQVEDVEAYIAELVTDDVVKG